MDRDKVLQVNVASAWVIRPDDVLNGRYPEGVQVVDTCSRDDDKSWAIRASGRCMNHEGDWEFEPLPSSRTDEFFARCRWPTLEAALVFACKKLDVPVRYV